MPTNKQQFESKMNALAASINTKAGLTGAKTIDQLKTAVDGISVGGVKPTYLLNDGDVVSDFYFNTETDLDSFLASLTYDETIEWNGTTFDACLLGLGHLVAVDGTATGLTNVYFLAWFDEDNDDNEIFYATDAVAAMGIVAGWQISSFEPVDAPEVVIDDINADFLAIMDDVIAQDDIAFGEHGIDTSDADATASDILSGKTAYVDGSKITGNIVSQAAQTITPTTTDQTIAAGKYLTGAQTIKGDANLVAGNIKKDVTIFGVTGTHEGGGGGKDHTFDVPTVSGTYTYTGSAQTPTLSGYYSDFMTLSGDTSVTNAGSYSITVSLKDTTNCQWRDGTTAAKTLSWSIAKAALPKPSLSEGTLSLSASTPSGTFTVTRSGDGTITATSSDTTNFSTSVSGTTVTVTALNPSVETTANIVVTVAEGTNYLAYTASDVVCVVSTVVQITKTTAFITTTSANATMPLALLAGDATTITVNWGDGNSSTFNIPAAVPRYATGSHTYTTAGDYQITFESSADTWFNVGATYNSTSYNIFNKKSNEANPTNIKLTKFVGKTGFRMGSNSFYNCADLTEVTWQEGAYFGVSSLRNCALIESLTIPDTITNIQYNAMDGCTSLKEIKSLPTTPPTLQANNVFNNVPADCAIYVPSGSVSAYQSATYWSARSAYIQAIPNS